MIQALIEAFFGQYNQHVIDWLAMLEDHGRDKYRPGDVVSPA